MDTPVERTAPVISAPFVESDVTIGQQLVSCFAASVVAEMIALPVYYPYDLMKTRMQTTEVKGEYKNLFDAFVKTYQEDLPKNLEKNGGVLKCTFVRLQRFYSAMPLYGGTYITFIAIEFSLYETLLRQIETKCEGKSVLDYSIEQLKSLKMIRETFMQTLERLMSDLKNEETDNKSVVG